MGNIPFVLLAICVTTVIGLTFNDTNTIQPSQNEAQNSNATTRRGKQIEIIQFQSPSKKIKRQIIKIPPSVSKVKLVQPPLNLKHNRAPQQFSRYPPLYRSGGPWKSTNKKSLMDLEAENSFLYDPRKVKRILKKPIVKNVFPEDFYREEFDLEGDRNKGVKTPGKLKRKKVKQNTLSEYLTNYEGGDHLRSPEEGLVGKINYGRSEDQSLHYESAGSSIHMKQVPAPNLYPQTNFGQFYDENYVYGMNIKKLPTKGRQIQSLFAQQYTTHNPQVTTNFGLNGANGVLGHYGGKGSFVDASPYDFSQLGKYSQPVAASSDQVVTTLPVRTPGIEVIQPPQFRDVTVSHPLHPSRLLSSTSNQKEETSSQKATIRDILDQDCPLFDIKGYCDSPPRYPMQQIKNMVKKCASFMEVMNTQPFEEPQEIYSFARRSDNHVDNKTGLESHSPLWSRSSSEGHTACTSDLELIEPGYAKEANSGRWFVIVQHPDTTVQRIATDTCRTPGKSCGGLSELKCNKINNLPSKSTRCAQRHTYQRLISWDPESPDECPRMRVFRFPSACVCHVGVV